MEKTLSSRKKKKQQPEKEKAAQGLTPARLKRIECISLFEPVSYTHLTLPTKLEV